MFYDPQKPELTVTERISEGVSELNLAAAGLLFLMLYVLSIRLAILEMTSPQAFGGS